MTDRAKTLQERVEESIAFNKANQGRFPSYLVDLDEVKGFRVGDTVSSKRNPWTHYTICSIEGEWAFIVPRDRAVCGYTILLDHLEKVDYVSELELIGKAEAWKKAALMMIGYVASILDSECTLKSTKRSFIRRMMKIGYTIRNAISNVSEVDTLKTEPEVDRLIEAMDDLEGNY